MVQKGLVLAGLENGFVVHYLSDVLLGDHQLRTQLDATFGCVLVVDQFVHVAVLDEAEVLFRLLVLEEVDPGGEKFRALVICTKSCTKNNKINADSEECFEVD